MKDCNECAHMCYHVGYWVDPIQTGRRMCDIKSKKVYDFVIDDFVQIRLVPCIIMKRLPFCRFELRQIEEG